MKKADSVSRRPDQEIGVEKDNKDKTLVKPEQLEARKAKVVEIIVDGVDLLKKVKQSKVRDDEVIKVVEEMKRTRVKVLRDKKQRKENSIMYKKEKVYVPKDNKLRVEIIRLYHDTLVGEHGGQQKMVELVTRNFWWPEVTKEVKRYIEEYNAYCKGITLRQSPFKLVDSPGS